MPKTLTIPQGKPTWGGEWSDGVEITWTPSDNRIDIGGWYDGCIGIQGESMSLRNFFDLLGITEESCKKAFKEVQ